MPFSIKSGTRFMHRVDHKGWNGWMRRKYFIFSLILHSGYKQLCLFCSELGQVISNTAREYATNAQNHVMTNLPKRLWRWVSWKLEKQLQLEHQTIRSLASSIVDALKANEFPSIPDTICDIQDPEHRIDAEIWFCNVFEKAKTIILEDRLLAEKDIKESWWAYLRPLWWILKTFKKNNRDDAAQ